MLKQDTITIKLDKNTAKKLSYLKQLNYIDNMTLYSKKALAKKVNDDYAELQDKIQAKLK